MSKDEVDFSFDKRVAVRYDEVRGHPPSVSQSIAESLAAELGGAAQVLEPGVGTGRIAKPLCAIGINVVGIDLSAQMLGGIADNSNHAGQLDLVRCDLNQLPFKEAAFDGIVCVHVLHLIEDWQGLLQELLSLLKPGGKIILGRDWVDPESFAGQIRNEFRRLVVELSETIVAPPGARAFVQTLLEQGAIADDEAAERTAAEWQTELTPAALLEEIGSKEDAESWVLTDDLLEKVMQQLNAFANETWADINQPLPIKRRFVYSLLEVPIN